MDRLSSVAGLAVGALAFGCDGGGTAAPPRSRSRVDAVQAERPKPVDLDGFCERRYAPESAPTLALPALRQSSGPAPTGTPRWINVWATWCKPCVEELPRLTRWRDELAPKLGFELVFLSADGDAAAVEAFAAEHPEVGGSLELQSAKALDPWTRSLGLPGSAVLPVHVFVDAEDRVRCLRSAGVGESERSAIEQLFATM